MPNVYLPRRTTPRCVEKHGTFTMIRDESDRLLKKCDRTISFDFIPSLFCYIRRAQVWVLVSWLAHLIAGARSFRGAADRQLRA